MIIVPAVEDPAPAAEVVVLAPALTGVVGVGGVVEAGDAADSDDIAIVVVQ